LREARVKDADFVFQHGDSESAEHALQDHRAERDYSKITNPVSRFAAPEPDRQDDRQESNCRSDQAVRVLEENSAHPFRGGEQKHVVAERGRPIGHGETNAFARDHSAAANE